MEYDEDFDYDGPLAIDIDELDDVELRIIAEKVIARWQRDALLERERRGLGDGWTVWSSM